MGLPQVMMVSIVLLLNSKLTPAFLLLPDCGRSYIFRHLTATSQTELGSIYLEEGTDLGDTSPFFCPALPFSIQPCAPHLPPLFCQSWSLALSLISAIARAPLS